MDREQRRFTVGEIKIERRAGDASLAEAKPTITGYAAVFNQRTDLGMFTESIAPGAFRDAVTRDDVVALWNHDTNIPLGRVPETLKLREDSHGLFYEIFPPDTSDANDLIKKIEAGIVRQSSFGFVIEQEELDKTGDKPHFTIKRVRLYDVSPVTFPAYKGTEVSVERSQSEQQQELEKRLEMLKKPSLAEIEASMEREARARRLQLLRF